MSKLVRSDMPARPVDLLEVCVDLGEMLENYERSEITKAEEAVGKEVTGTVVRETGAYRAALRLITPDRRFLRVAGWCGEFPEEFLSQSTSLEDDTAAAWAVASNENYYIEDTALAYRIEDGKRLPKRYRPVPPEAQSHGSVLMRHGVHVLAVLSVDWDKPGAFTHGTCQTLEQLVDRYGQLIRSRRIDCFFALLEDYLHWLAVRGECTPDYKGVLQCVARMVGVPYGSIFMRRQETGRYHLVASMLYPHWSADEHWYEPGEGVTGWVAKHNRPLRIADLSDCTELKAINPGDPPIWSRKHGYGLDLPDWNRSYLGVPIAVGSDVLGVLRLANSKTGFGIRLPLDKWVRTYVQDPLSWAILVAGAAIVVPRRR